MKILITGGSGLLGNNLALSLSEQHEVYATYNRHSVNLKNCHMVPLDITNAKSVHKTIHTISPECIVHTAALTDVDYCEEHPEKAHLLNVVGPKNIVDASQKIDPWFIYISTDSVFDGRKGMYTEEEPANPINVYGSSKLKGEKVVKESNLDWSILRTNFYGTNIQPKHSLAEWMLYNLKKNERITLFHDVYFTPILVNNLSKVIIEVIENELRGLYHAGGSERCSKLEFGVILAELFDLNKELIDPISIDKKNFKAKRPKDPSLESERIKKKIKTKILNVREGLEWFKKLVQ